MKQAVAILILRGPPSSPPTMGRRLMTIRKMHTTAHAQNTHTEYPREPGSTINLVPQMACLRAAMVQAMPMPRKTLTALLPVTLPIDESAVGSLIAAPLLANVSEKKHPALYKSIPVNVLLIPKDVATTTVGKC